MRFNICIVSPKGYPHAMAFMELAELLLYSLRELGCEAQWMFNELDAQATNILIGCHLLNREVISAFPPSTVVLNTEQIYSDTTEWNPLIFEFARHFEVWDYSERNMQKWTELGVERVKHLKIGFQKELVRIPKVEAPSVDVLFYGAVTDRRAKILHELIERGLRVKSLFNVYGAERDEWIARAKVVLNHHHYQSEIFEVVRMFYLMSNAKAVVAEVNPSTSVDPMYLGGFAAAPYEGLVDACERLVHDEAERTRLEACALATISRYPQVNFMAELLN